MTITKELLEDMAGYYTRKGMHCELPGENMLKVWFEDPRLENLKKVPIVIVVDAANLSCKLFCFSLYQVPEEKEVAAAVLMNTINNAEFVFPRYSVDDDNEVKASLCMIILPDNMPNSLLLPGVVARMAKDIDSVYPVIKNNLES